MKQERAKQCSLCCAWTDHYIDVPSGNRDSCTGETPMDNTVCSRCQREARAFNLLGKATEKWLLEHRHTA